MNLAPNGKPSNLTAEQYKLVRTTAFKDWFGDWENEPENSSKVVDENGEPLVVYHGSKSNHRFNIFNIISETHRGIEVGSHFGTYIQSQKIIKHRESKGLGFELYEVFLCIKNIIKVDDINWWTPANINKFILQKYKIQIFSNNPSAKDIIEQLNKNHINGFAYSNLHEGEGRSYVVFNSTQIKLANGTNTTFDGSNPDIRFDVGGEVIPKGKEGDCYKNVQDYLLDNDLPNAFIVHGEVTNGLGKTIGHAWIVNGVYVIDPTTGVITTKEEYYERLNPKEEARYNIMDAIKMRFKTQNYGAWTDAEVKKILGNVKKFGGYVSYRDKYNKKYNYEKNESHSLKEISKDTGVSNKGLQKIYNKGIGAFKTNPGSVRPTVKSKEQWAKARVYSAVMGGKAARVDAKELKMNNGGEILLAPNGNPSNLTAIQYRIVRTPAFKEWFGDWERLANATIKDPAIDVITLGNISKDVSKLVDSNGEPLVVFRGMSEKSSKKYIFNYNYYQIKESGRRNKFGFYFTDNYDVARGYAIDSSRKKIIEKIKNIYNVYENSNDFEADASKNAIVKEYFVKINNYLDLRSYDSLSYIDLLKILNVSDKDISDFIEKYFWKKSGRFIQKHEEKFAHSKRAVYDLFITQIEGDVDIEDSIGVYFKNKITKKYNGVVFTENTHKKSDTYVAFEPNQIKLANGTNTTFDGSNPDIRFNGGGVVDADIPTYLYHTTPSNNFQKIKQNGLLVAFDNRIYFTKNLSSSIDIANQLHKAYKENENVEFYHIWKIDTNKLTNPIFFKDEDYDNAVYTTESIPKNAIKYYESTKIKYADGGGYIGSCVDIGSSNKEVCEYFPNATIMAEYVGNPDENEWGKSKETTPKEFYKYVSKDDVPKEAINGEHTYHYIAQDGSNRDMNINETAIYFIYNMASDIHYFFKKTKHKTGGDLVNEPYISDNFQIGPNGAYEHTEENEIINQYADGVDLTKKLKKLKKPKGDCYYAAAQLVMGNRFKHLFGDNNITYIGTPYLVHAEVRGQGKVANIRFGHAWVEDDENIYDYSNGNQFVMPKEIYYAIGDIDNQNPLKYQKYTFEEARRKMVTTRHYGEWDLEVDC
jgi:ADP-Ribosyltransferase in polyvalent proteins/Family of unknown function (DUF5824)